MPLELVFLHVRPSDLTSPTTSVVLSELVSGTNEWTICVQILLHRYINVAWTDDDRVAFASFFQALLAACSDERLQQNMKVLLFGEEGLLAAFQATQAPFQSSKSGSCSRMTTADGRFPSHGAREACPLALVYF